MKNKLFCKILFKTTSFFILISFIIIILFFIRHNFVDKNFPAVIFFDIGQGDSALIRNINGKNILIDGGPDNKVLKKIGKFLPYFNRKIDYLILSHYHEDHVTGLIELSKRYSVDKLFLAKNLNTNYLQDLLIKNIEDNKVNSNSEVFWIEDYLNLNLGNGCYLSFLNPKSFTESDNDNDSLINKLVCKNDSFLFSGDNELNVEEVMVKKVTSFDAKVLKASHHGSKTSNTLEFLKLVDPDFFVISVGVNNRHKHPSKVVLSRAIGLGLSVLRTDLDQDIIFELSMGNN